MTLFRQVNLFRLVLLLIILAAVAGWVWHRHVANRAGRTHFSVQDRLQQYGSAADARVKPYFDAAGVSYPPEKLVMVGLKAERQLQLYAPGPGGALKFLHAYPILAASMAN